MVLTNLDTKLQTVSCLFDNDSCDRNGALKLRYKTANSALSV